MADSEPEALLQEMSGPTLSAEAGLGQSVPNISYMTLDKVVSVVGQKLKFAEAAALSDTGPVWHAANGPHGITLVATCPKAQLFAFTERSIDPKIFVCSYPDMMFQYTLELSPEATTPLEFTAIAFSRSGDRFAALCGLPEPTLVVWSLKTQEVLASGPLSVQCDGLSFCPDVGGPICSIAPKRLLMWDLKLIYKTHLLDSTEVRARRTKRPFFPRSPPLHIRLLHTHTHLTPHLAPHSLSLSLLRSHSRSRTRRLAKLPYGHATAGRRVAASTSATPPARSHASPAAAALL